MATSENGRSRLADAAWDDPTVTLVVMDLASVESHFLAQPLSWLKSADESEGALWCPLRSDPAELDHDRDAARQVTERLRLPLNWPQRHPQAVPRAMRIAALGAARGCAAAVVFTLSTLAFGSGMDLEGGALREPDPEDPYESFLEPLQNRTGLDAHEMLLAAEHDSIWDQELRSIADNLARVGIASAPTLRWRGEIYRGSRAIASVLGESESHQAPMFSDRDTSS